MADDTPPAIPPRPPVRMGLRVVARHSAGRAGGRVLAQHVIDARQPKLLDAATRLARIPAPPAPPPPPAPAFSEASGAAAGRRPAPRLGPPGLGAAGDERLRRAVDVRRQAVRERRPDRHGPGRADARADQGAEARPFPRPRRAGALARRPDRRGRRHGGPISAEELGLADAGPKKLARAPLPDRRSTEREPVRRGDGARADGRPPPFDPPAGRHARPSARSPRAASIARAAAETSTVARTRADAPG